MAENEQKSAVKASSLKALLGAAQTNLATFESQSGVQEVGGFRR